MVVIGHKLFYSSTLVIFRQKSMYSGESGCIRTKVVVIGQKMLYSGKSACIR